MADKLLTIPQAAEMLALAPATLRKWVWQRRIPSVSVGRARRLRLLDVEALVRFGSQAARDRTRP